MSLSSAEEVARFEATPIASRNWPASTYEALRDAATSRPDRPALSSIVDADTDGETLSYAELLGRVHRLANVLSALGNRTTDVTAYLLPNSVSTQIVLWGAQAAGIVFPLNWLLSPEHIVALLNEAGVRVLISAPAAPDQGWPGWEGLRPHLAGCPTLRHVLLLGPQVPLDAAEESTRQETFQVSSLQPLLDAQPAEHLIFDRVFNRADPSSYFGTGGTTGLPKIARRSHWAEVANAMMLSAALGDALSEARLLVGLPLFHVNAALTSFATWLRGGEVVLAGRGYRDPAVMEGFWRIVERRRITFFSAVPTVLSDLLARPIDADVSTLRFAICGAAPLSVELLSRFEVATGLKILEGYGLTESTCVASINPLEGERRVGSVGLRLVYESLACVMVDDAGRYVRDCATDETGVVILAGSNIFDGYTNPAHDVGLWLDLGDGRRWLNTGDLGRLDADGYLWLTGRRKELIIRAGHNIDPQLIEEALYRHPAVKLAAAVGRPDGRVGELPVAYVSLTAGAEATEAELLAFATKHIADRSAVPRQVIILSDLPTSPVGKILKTVLVEREIRGVVERAASETGTTLSAISIRMAPDRSVVMISGTGCETLIEHLSNWPFKVEQTGEPIRSA